MLGHSIGETTSIQRKRWSSAKPRLVSRHSRHGVDEVAEKHGNAEGELAQKDAVSGGGGTRYREMSISLAHSSEI